MSTQRPDQITLAELLALSREAAALDLSSRKRVLTDIGGTHLSGFRGRGMEFEEHRAYQPGDDVRAIDWRVTARTGQTHIKLFREERERPVYLLVDLSPSMFFATRGVFKSVLASQVIALLGWAAVANRDRVGGIIVGANGLREIRPGSGRRGLLRYLNQLATEHQHAAEKSFDSQLESALGHIDRLARSGAVVMLLSDFQSLPASAKPLLQKLASRCELIAAMVSDPFERELPSHVGLPVTSTAQPEQRWFIRQNKTATGEVSSDATEAMFNFQQRQQFWSHALKSAGARWLDLDTAKPALSQLTQGLGQHHRAQISERKGG